MLVKLYFFVSSGYLVISSICSTVILEFSLLYLLEKSITDCEFDAFTNVIFTFLSIFLAICFDESDKLYIFSAVKSMSVGLILSIIKSIPMYTPIIITTIIIRYDVLLTAFFIISFDDFSSFFFIKAFFSF